MCAGFYLISLNLIILFYKYGLSRVEEWFMKLPWILGVFAMMGEDYKP